LTIAKAFTGTMRLRRSGLKEDEEEEDEEEDAAAA
jgi:hypothetical protein